MTYNYKTNGTCSVNIKLELDENYYKNPSYDTDNQLQGAINYLIK